MVTEKDVCKCGYNSAMWYAYLLRAWRMAPYETSFDEELQEVGKYMGSIEETCKVSLERAKNELVMLRNKIDTVPPEEKEHSYEYPQTVSWQYSGPKYGGLASINSEILAG